MQQIGTTQRNIIHYFFIDVRNYNITKFQLLHLSKKKMFNISQLNYLSSIFVAGVSGNIRGNRPVLSHLA